MIGDAIINIVLSAARSSVQVILIIKDIRPFFSISFQDQIQRPFFQPLWVQLLFQQILVSLTCLYQCKSIAQQFTMFMKYLTLFGFSHLRCSCNFQVILTLSIRPEIRWKRRSSSNPGWFISCSFPSLLFGPAPGLKAQAKAEGCQTKTGWR